MCDGPALSAPADYFEPRGTRGRLPPGRVRVVGVSPALPVTLVVALYQVDLDDPLDPLVTEPVRPHEPERVTLFVREPDAVDPVGEHRVGRQDIPHREGRGVAAGRLEHDCRRLIFDARLLQDLREPGPFPDGLVRPPFHAGELDEALDRGHRLYLVERQRQGMIDEPRNLQPVSGEVDGRLTFGGAHAQLRGRRDLVGRSTDGDLLRRRVAVPETDVDEQGSHQQCGEHRGYYESISAHAMNIQRGAPEPS